MPSHIPYPNLGPNDTQDARGRVLTYLGIGAQYSNTAGWQYRSRLVMQQLIGRRLDKSEHVHHINGNRADDRVENLEVLAAWYHGRIHAYAACVIYTKDGVRFASPDNPDVFLWPRRGAVLGPAAIDTDPSGRVDSEANGARSQFCPTLKPQYPFER